MASASKFDLHSVSTRALQMFVAVEETGSMTEAAARLGASRSAVSQQITNLEQTVGAKLFDRSSRPVSLTPVGAVLWRHAHRILEAVSDARTDLMMLSLPSMVELRMGIIDDLDATITPDLVAHLRQRYPRCQLAITSGRSDDLTCNLARREVDLVLTGILPEGSLEYQDFPILREPFMLVAPRGLLDPGGNLRRQVESLTFVRYSASMPIGRAITQQLQRLRIELYAPFSFDASRSVFAMMLKCNGWTITTPLCVLDSGLDLGHIDCFRLPFASFGRTIRLVARREELGRLPQQLAKVSRELIATRLVPELGRLAPWLPAEFTILGNDGEALTHEAASAPAAEQY